MSPEKFLLDFIESIGNVDFDFVIKGLGFLFVFFWLIVVGWVYADVSERTTNRAFKILSVILVAILNLPGLIIYLILRPRQSIAEIYWSDLERRYLKYETAELGDCFNCGFQLQPGFVNCPNCAAVIKIKCAGCGVYIDKGWKHCPFCSRKNPESEVAEDLSTDEMEKRIAETKKDVEQKVKTKGTRYATRTGFAVKIGDVVLGAVRNWGAKIDSVFRGPQNKPVKKSKASK